MKSPKSSGKSRKRKRLLIIRRVSGASMLPALMPGRVVAGVWFRRLRPGQMVIIHHGGLEKIKRIHGIRLNQVFVLGDNPAESTDSRSFGWLPLEAVKARIIWPRRVGGRSGRSVRSRELL